MKHILNTTAIVATLACTVATAQEQLRPAERQPAAVDAETPAPGTKLKAKSAKNDVRLQLRPDGAVASASGFVTRAYAGTKQDAARAFLSEHRDMLGGIAPESLKAIVAKSLRSRTYVRYQQHYEGVPIHGAPTRRPGQS